MRRVATRRPTIALGVASSLLAGCAFWGMEDWAAQEAGATGAGATGAGGTGAGGTGGGGLAPPDCTHYASPLGGGDGRTQDSPFLVSDFWPVAAAGDTLCLLDGRYTGAGSMIAPPEGLNGEPDRPIVVSALHDGAVLIDGEGAWRPVMLNDNDWFVVQRLDACCSNYGVVEIDNSSDIKLARVIMWGIGDMTTTILGVYYSSVRVLVEDCATLGGGRGHFTTKYTPGPTTFRRIFARLGGSTIGWPAGIASGNDVGNAIFENVIATADGTFEQDLVYLDANGDVYGSLVYHTPGAVVMGSVLGAFRWSGSFRQARDILVVFEGSDADYGGSLGYGSLLGAGYPEEGDGLKARNMTFLGGPGTLVARWPTATVSHLLATDVAWASPSLTYAVESHVDSDPPEYVMVWNNTKEDFNKVPMHWTETDPQLLERCGNVLQYGCSSRPEVEGQPVGAQIQCRYEDGTLTDKPLWPWPMNERIRRRTCEYDGEGDAQACADNPALGLDLTSTVFSLHGGAVPDFAARNPDLCPGE
jgi:hypothetical protein